MASMSPAASSTSRASKTGSRWRRSSPRRNEHDRWIAMTDEQVGQLGHFGPFGGQYVAETLIPALEELDAAWRAAQADPAFKRELDALFADYVGRPSRLTLAEGLSRAVDARGGARIYLKREDLNHTGAHKINNCVGQALLARRMGKKRIIAETGAGQHGVATATIAAKF